MKGLILAGGKGTRLRPLTINTPKPIVPVANSPFLLYQVDLMRSGGIEEIILSLSYQPRKIEDLLKDGSDYGVRIRYAVEASPLGTGGAFNNAEEHLDRTSVVCLRTHAYSHLTRKQAAQAPVSSQRLLVLHRHTQQVPRSASRHVGQKIRPESGRS